MTRAKAEIKELYDLLKSVNTEKDELEKERNELASELRTAN